MEIKWPTKEQEERMKPIGQNGNTGENYGKIKDEFEQHVHDTCDYLQGDNGESE